MESQKYYNSILSDITAFDKVTLHLENMAIKGENPRIRHQAQVTLQHLNTVLKICEELNKRD